MESVIRFAAVAVDKSAVRSVLVRRARTSHNIHFHERTRISTSVSCGDGCLGFGVIHDLGHNNSKRPVQSPSWRPQPLNLHADRSPLRLEGVLLPLIDRLDEVERTAIPEVQPRPSHADTLLLVAA